MAVNIKFHKKHLKILLILFLIDMIATIVWNTYWGVSEWNPILSGPLSKSALLFAITKIALSFPPLLILEKYLERLSAQIAIAITTFAYMMVTAIHYFIFIFFLIESM